MRKVSFAIILCSTALFFQYCSSSKKAAAAMPAAVTFQANVMPVIQSSCAPCHIEGKGNKKPLDNFASASSVADDMIVRIQKNPGERGFMPMKHEKLSDSAILVFVNWKKDGLKEK
jgi:hypothetical protein